MFRYYSIFSVFLILEKSFLRELLFVIIKLLLWIGNLVFVICVLLDFWLGWIIWIIVVFIVLVVFILWFWWVLGMI